MTSRPLSAQEQMQMAQAVELHKGGKLEQAREAYQKVLTAHPRNADVLRLFGSVESQLGNLQQGARLLARSLEISPDQPGAYYSLGDVLQSLGNFGEAVASYDKALALAPDQADAWFNRGNILLEWGKNDQAIASYDRALLLEPRHAEAHNNRGAAQLELKRYGEAIASYGKAIALRPTYAEAYRNQAIALEALGRVDEAVEAYKHAVAAGPKVRQLHVGLARLYERYGQVEQAFDQWADMADQFNGQGQARDKAMALGEMSRILMEWRDYEEAERTARQSLSLNPTRRSVAQHFLNARQGLCAWPIVAPFNGVSRDDLLAGMSPLAASLYTDDPLLQLAINALNYAAAVSAAKDTVPPAFTEPRDGRLHIGYLSSDLREHPIGHLMYEVLELHDRTKVVVHAYYSGPAANDPLHRRYKETADHFIDISSMSDDEAAERIRADGVEVLVDINGHTRHSRKGVLDRQPAPVIVNWLGFPGSVGSPRHQYIIADDWVIPPEFELYYSEKVLRLPCYQPNNRRRIVAEAPSRASAGLPDDAFVFCCFNDAKKISRHTFDRWIKILLSVPGSVLWLLGAAEATCQNLRAHAALRGLDPSRIVFADWKPNPEHLARYPLADLFLDTTPYGAHTTCSDALWMGVPVVTFSGRSFASRVCGSLLRQAGLPELVCTRAGEFVNLAVALAKDPGRLAGYRAQLKASRDTCVLFDTPRLVSELEALYAQMRKARLAGTLPVPDLRNMDAYLKAGLGHDHEEVEVQTLDDYEAHWRERLARLNAIDPIPFDDRLWTKGH